MNSMLQKRLLEDMMKEPEPEKRVSIVRLRMLREDHTLYGMGQIEKPQQAVETVSPLLAMADREIIVVMSLDAGLYPVAVEIAAVGGVSSCPIDVRNIFKHAIMSNAEGVMCFHNHPAGNLEPSREDFAATEIIRQAGEILGIPLLDHIIIGNGGFYSFKAKGMLGRKEPGYAASGRHQEQEGYCPVGPRFI